MYHDTTGVESAENMKIYTVDSAKINVTYLHKFQSLKTYKLT